jgi:hypothetical protein
MSCGSLCSRFSSLASGTDDGFFFFNLAKIDDSLSGNGGISSNTVALKIKMFKCNQRKTKTQHNMHLTPLCANKHK